MNHLFDTIKTHYLKYINDIKALEIFYVFSKKYLMYVLCLYYVQIPINNETRLFRHITVNMLLLKMLKTLKKQNYCKF